MRARVWILAALAAALAGCGGGDGGASGVLSDTAAKLPEIRSGVLSMRLIASSAGGEKVGFELEGPFSLAGDGPLPVADVEVTQIAGSQQGTTRFLSTGRQAFLEVEGTTYELPAAEFALGSSSAGAGAGLGKLDIGDWFVDPSVSDGGEVDGAATDRVSAELDVVAALNDLLAATRDLGGFDVSLVEGAHAENLRGAVRSSTVEVLTGKNDRLLRRISLTVDLGAAGTAELRQALGSLAGAHIDFELTIAGPNEPVGTVEAPADAVPYAG